MLPLRIEGATRVLGVKQAGVTPLAIKDVVEDDVPTMMSLWEPTPAELALLIAGGAVELTIAGVVHPPVRVNVQERKE